MADFEAVEFDGGPSSSQSDPGNTPSVLDGMETTPDVIPAGLDATPDGNVDLKFGEEISAAIANDGSAAGTLEEAAAFFASDPSDPPEQKPEDPLATNDDGKDFFDLMGEDPEIGPEYAASLREKHKGDLSAAMRGLVSGNRRLSQRDEEAALGRALRENPQAVMQQLGVTPPQPGEDPQRAADQVRQRYNEYLADPQVWGAVKYDPAWEDQVEIVLDAEGNPVGLKAKPGVAADVPGKLRAYHEWKAKKQDEFIRDPTTIWNAIAPGVQSLIDSRIAAQQQQNQGQASITAKQDAFLNNNAHWLYNNITQADGRVVNGPRTLDNLSGPGKVFFDGITEARDELGIQSIEGQVKYAGRIMKEVYATKALQNQKQQAAPPKTAPVQSQIAPGLDNGSLYDPDSPLSLEQQIRRNLKAAAIGGIN